MKTCTKCGETKPVAEFGKNASKRSGLQSQCKVCSNIRSAAWRAANPDRARAAVASCHMARPENARAAYAKWREKNREKCRVLAAKWRELNVDRAKETTANWRTANPEAYRQAKRLREQNRRARERRNGGRLSKGLTDKLFTLQRGKCACGCKQPLGDDYHLDHRMPLALGGTNTDDNIQLLRSRCNQQKGARHPINFMQQRGFLL